MAIKLKISSPPRGVNFPGYQYQVRKDGIPKDDVEDSEIAMNKGREGYYGWFGYGGSVVQWHPELKIGFAFIPTFMTGVELVNERGAVLQQIVKDCCSITSNKE